MQIEEEREDCLKQSKKSVLNQDIPDELKAVLYQDYLRTLHTKRHMDEATPVLVKSVLPEQATTSTDPTVSAKVKSPKTPPPLIPTLSKRHQALMTHLKNNGVTLSNNQELIINGKVIKKSSIHTILSALDDPFSRGIKAKGFLNIVGLLRQTKAPKSVLPPGYQHLLQPPVKTRSQTGHGIKLGWTTYHF